MGGTSIIAMEVNWLLRQLDVSHLLGRNLTLEESRDLRRRRRDFQRKWHPDKTVDEADAISRTVLLQRFNAAWELLTPRLTPEPVPMEVPVSEGLRQSPPYARAQPYANPGSSSGPTQSPPRYIHGSFETQLEVAQARTQLVLLARRKVLMDRQGTLQRAPLDIQVGTKCRRLVTMGGRLQMIPDQPDRL